MVSTSPRDSSRSLGRLAADKGLQDRVAYFRRDLVNDPLDGRFRHYDAILINAVLHHLSATEVSALMKRVAAALAPGGKLYIYEPINPRADSRTRRTLLYPIDFVFRVLMFAIGKAGKFLRLFKDNFAAAMRLGYTGTSPDEKPMPIDGLRSALRDQGLQIVEERPFHSYSLAFAMSIVRLRPAFVRLLTPPVRVFYKLDAWLFKSFGWQNFRNGSRFVQHQGRQA